MTNTDIIVYLIVFVCVVAHALVSIKINKAKEDAPGKRITTPLIANFIITFAIALTTFLINYSQANQLNRIENVGKKTEDTSTKTLDTIEATKALAEEIKILQGINNGIVSNIDKLTAASNKVLKSIDSTTTQSSQENALSGQLDLGYSKPFSENDMLYISFGSYSMGNTLYQIKNWHPKFITIYNKNREEIQPVKFSVVNNKLVVTLTAYDIYGNWIVDIENNNWHRNPNYTGKFNYDSRGFEVIDNKNNISLNLDLLSGNHILMQGYIPVKEANRVFIAGSKYFTNLYLSRGEDIITQTIKDVQIKQLFEYNGKGWLHKRKKYK